MDVLTDVLTTLRLHSSLYFRAEFGGAWSARVPHDPNTVRFHLLLQGECWVEIPSRLKPTLMSAGDVILIPHGVNEAHRVSPNGRFRQECYLESISY